MFGSVKRGLIGTVVIGAVALGIAVSPGTVGATHSVETTQSSQCSTAISLYNYWNDLYQHATDKKEKNFDDNMRLDAAFRVGWICSAPTPGDAT